MTECGSLDSFGPCPTKSVIAHTICAGCGAAIQLGGIVSAAACSSCKSVRTIDLSSWDWVLERGERTVTEGQDVRGETRLANATCGRCHADVPEEAVARTLASRGASAACTACGAAIPVRLLPSEAEHPWKMAFFGWSAVVGGDDAPTSTAPAKLAPPLNVPCSKCGAPLAVDGSNRAPTCTYCGVRTLLPDDVWRELTEPGVARPRPFFLWMSPEKQAERQALVETIRRANMVASRNWKVPDSLLGAPSLRPRARDARARPLSRARVTTARSRR